MHVLTLSIWLYVTSDSAWNNLNQPETQNDKAKPKPVAFFFFWGGAVTRARRPLLSDLLRNAAAAAAKAAAGGSACTKNS